MPSLTLSEIVAIVLVILIVFGPQRLPEIARKTAVLIRHARSTLATLRDEFENEYGEFTEPLREVRDEVAGVRRDLDNSVAAVTEDIRRLKAQAEVQDTEGPVGPAGPQDGVTTPPPDTAPAEPAPVEATPDGDEAAGDGASPDKPEAS
jgi:sec-independent protein translocase protein TatB